MEKMREPVVPFNRTYYGPHEEAAIIEALRRGHIAGDGEFSRRAESRLRNICNAPHILLTPSCSHALELGLQALSIAPGDEVVCPSFTFPSIANAVIQLGATPVFCEITTDTLNLDPADLDRCITKHTRAIAPTHYGGVPCDMDAIRDAIGDRPIRIVEDAAHALGSSYRGHPAGSFGDLAAFSFHDTKNIACGEGGAMTTADPLLMARAEIIRENGTNRTAFIRGDAERYAWMDKGSSYLLSDLLAAVLVAQLDRMAEILEKRKAVWEVYQAFLDPVHQAGRISLGTIPDGVRTNYHCFWFLARDASDRENILSRLRLRGVMATSHYVPLDNSPYAKKNLRCEETSLPVTQDVSRRLVRLPLYQSLTGKEVQYVLEALEEALKG